MIRILRLSTQSELTSARVFEHGFTTSLTGHVQLHRVSAARWLSPLLDANESRPADHPSFTEATIGFDFLCPDYQTTLLIPLLLHQRNLSTSPIRLLLIAHAPGMCPVEWALLGPLLRPGDLIVAPSRSALDVINYLSSALTPHVCVIPHPVPPLPHAGHRDPHRIVALSRIHPWKLLHRQIDAVALLRRAGYPVTLQIAGSLNVPGQDTPSPYARALAARVRRLHLGECVEFVGEIDNEALKGHFLAEAGLLVNLSVTVEESFGKAPAEALGCGVPVLATHWDGLPGTIGPAGACVPVTDTGLGMDTTAHCLADATRRLLEEPPPPDYCRQQAERFHPERVGPLYRTKLCDALDAHAASKPPLARPPDDLEAVPERGLLTTTAPLTQYGWWELFGLHLSDARNQHARLAGLPATATTYETLRSLMIAAVRRPLGRFMAGLEPGEPTQTLGHVPTSQPRADLTGKVATAALSRGTRSSRIACLSYLAELGQARDLEAGLRDLRHNGPSSPAIRYLEIESLHHNGRCAQAFALALKPGESALRGELAAPIMRQLATLAHELARPELALPPLREWLQRYPDAPDSGLVWLDRCAAALSIQLPLLVEARSALDTARDLLGDTTEIEKLETQLHHNELLQAYARIMGGDTGAPQPAKRTGTHEPDLVGRIDPSVRIDPL